LKEGIYNREIFDNRYEVFRRDRDVETSNKSGPGGGVCVAVLRSHRYTIIHRNEWECKNVEDLWVTLKTSGHSSIHINCAYIPGDSPDEKLENYTSNVALHINNHPDDIFIILGDFNVPSFSPPTPCTPSRKAQLLREMMDFCSIDQHNIIRSAHESNNLLDLVFSNRYLKVSLCHEALSKIDNYHPPLNISLDVKLAANPEPLVIFRNFKKMTVATWKLLNNDLLHVNWPLEFQHANTTDELVNCFYGVIEDILDIHCPEVAKKSFKHPCWFSKDTINLLGKKRAYHAKWKLHRNKRDYKKFSQFRKEAKESVDNDFITHNRSAETDIKTNPKSFWKFVNEKKSNGAGVSEYVKLGDKIAFNKQDAANLFAEQFSGVYESSTSETIDENTSQEVPAATWTELFIPMHTIYDKLSSLDVKKAPGPDKLPPIFFRKCATALTHPLFVIFDSSLRSGVFPSLWKIAHVTPIHKGESPHDVMNYRPISKLCIAAKILDNIVADELFDRFESKIIPQQHGFFRKRSTVTNLANYTEKLQRSLDKTSQTDVIYTDFSKAFDKVNHHRLIKKLRDFGIGGVMLKWMESYIVGRTQFVQIGDCLSKPIDVLSSVVQGSHLGPLLFSCFINDVGVIFNEVDFCIYADDLKVSKEINSQKDAEVLQENLHHLAEYVKENHLSLNVKKCVVASFTRKTSTRVNFQYKLDNVVLERKDSIRDLGVIYDSQLTFNDHVDAICSRARRMLGFVMRTGKHFESPFTFTTLYNALVRSIVEYATVIWNPHTAQQKIQVERIQHKFLSFISAKCFNRRSHEDVNYAEIEGKLRLDTLETRRKFAEVKFTVNSFNGIIDGQTFLQNFVLNNQQRFEMRSNKVFAPVASRTNSGRFSVFNRLMTSFNETCDNDNWLKNRPEDHNLKNNIRAKMTDMIANQHQVPL
jgi:hypothetical protein